MPRGQADVRATQRVCNPVCVSQSRTNQLHRMRFYGIDEEGLATISEALAIAREELGTNHDAVALANICTHFLTSYSPTPGADG